MPDIKILGSPCSVSDYYEVLIDKIAAKLNLKLSVERIEDEAVIAAYGVSVNCLFGYCPGCYSNNLGNDELNVPALVVDGEVVFHSVVPSEDALTELLSGY